MTPEHYHDLIVATAMLLGGEPAYDDCGHPERAQARKYWSIWNPGGVPTYGHTKWECAQSWLWEKGVHVWRDTGNITKPPTLASRKFHDSFSTNL